MAELLQTVKLDDDEQALMTRLAKRLTARAKHDARMGKYYEGSQRLDQIGIAVPPELRRFETVVNWPRVVVDEVVNRLEVRGFVEAGQEGSSEELREQWEANNLESGAPMLHQETAQYGRGFVTVGTNEDDPDHPLITVEPTRQMAGLVDARTRRALGYLRAYKDEDGRQRRTLYLPDATVWLEATRNGWTVEDRDDHQLGRPPVVMFLNRRRPGDWWGTSEMADAIPLTDAAARSLTNLQIAQEAHAVPGRYIFGVDPKKMVDPTTGEPLPTWEAYYTALMVYAEKDAKAGTFAAAELSNLTGTIEHYGKLVASVSGLPLRYFVASAANPAAEGAIRADESRLIKNAERKALDWGDGWGWVQGLSTRIRTGEWPEANRIRTIWFDPATPTYAERADAISKMTGGVPVLSREGAWDEMGWSDARKAREREYFRAQEQDPTLSLLDAKDNAGASADAAGGR
ncbi:phage portal protein [Cellulomonas palmilytica]|uniref:phage portal protein n=1 Tax=Cellulomonas palmilytica TaxID=2608402 RepID=UPI001F2F09EB|nr:phage portal protein [Cellulomonas palmilytica]UJP39336.1 phage portal protein [Cellulomonas palmilytica]